MIPDGTPPEGRRRQSSALPVVVALALVLAVVGVAVVRRTGSPPVATLQPGNAGGQTHGDAHISSGRGGGFLVLRLQNVPPAPAGRHYAVWVLQHGTSTLSPIGTFRPASRDVTLRLALPDGGPYSVVDVSVQGAGAPDVNSGLHLASGSFASSARG